ncbi:MAG: glucose 1-dehydrogenase [Coxiellaceae bacterium]|nr:glucose 1-dehydrogenase [Coxiellaceae bacterium]
MKNKIVIITGATKGMGLASAKHLLKLGAKVSMVYSSDQQTAEKVATNLAEYKDNMLLLQADITNRESRQRIVDETISNFGGIDVLINNAGVAAKKGFLKTTEEDYDRVLDVNLKAPVFLAQLVAKYMIEQKRGGSIINFSSVCGHRGAGVVSYDAAKAGIIRATQSMANTLGVHNIRVNSISPGTHKTEMNRAHWEGDESEILQKMNACSALKRSAEASEIAGTVEYLASDMSSFTTGTDILVDGGFLSYYPGRN